MTDLGEPGAIGTRLRHVLELLDGDVATVYAELGLSDYRPRFSPIVRVLVRDGPMAVRDIARAVGVTHSAASQTVAQMARVDLVELRPGTDARQRIVHLADRAQALMPTIQAEWTATVAAMRELDDELPMPLGDLLADILTALRTRSFRQRISDAGLADELRRNGGPPGPARPVD
ncbi:MAG: MarR family transcriptional regulator [Actinocatenispora sp.]